MTDQTHCRELLSSYLTTQGFFTEAENVLNGVDLESYENELSLVAFVLMARALASAPEGGAVAWLEVEPGVSLEQAAGEHGTLIHSMQVHLGRKKPIKRQEANGLFPLFTRSNAKAGEVVEVLKECRRELHACQAVIHLAGGFDPAYVTGAQAAMAKVDAFLSTPRGDASEMGVDK